MNCRKVNHLLSAYLDGELPGVESLQIRDHLRQCADCTSDYEDLLGMKRLLGRLKIQEPAHDMAEVILQSIRIDSDLRAQRSPFARLQQFSETLRLSIPKPKALGVGFGVAAAATLIYTQSLSANQVRVVGEWDHSVPRASEFTAGVRYPNPDRFVTGASASGGTYSGIQSVSYSSGFQNYQAPSQFSSVSGYSATGH